MNIIITGASQGIGNAVVKKLAENPHHHIIAISRNADKLNSLVNDCQTINPESSVYPVAFDLTSANYAFELLPKILEKFDQIDILINNAGYLVKKDFFDLTDDDFDRTFNINVKTAFKLTRALFPNFKSGTHIINISSMGGIQGSAKFPGLSLYSAAKGAVAVMTEAMAEEFKDRGISVNCLAFGAVQTEMLARAFPGYQAPLSPEEMAGFVADFALNGNKYFNGKILPVSVSTP
jgi:NAD(P)-dependent dehydrogenase (short-subunit alcohol dehydrogenase family)